jgi:hypothetical protein
MRTLACYLLLSLAVACATPPPPPACVRFQRVLDGLAEGGGPDADLQSHALADGLLCLQADFDAFRRIAFAAMDDERSFELADDHAGGRACKGEVALVIAAIPHLGAAGYDLSDTDGVLSAEERARLAHALRRE